MNLLLTSAGRRAYLVKYFKEAIGSGGKVFVSNSDENCVSFQYADESIVTPIIYDENYIPFLLDICKKKSIDVLISLFDIDLLVLAKNKNKFKEIGTNVIVSNEEIISVCNDKWLTYNFLKNHSFNTPKTFLKIDDVLVQIKLKKLCYPIIVKPRFGCGSISICLARDEEELLFYSKLVKENVMSSYLKYESSVTNDVVIYQECLKGQEYGADVINDLNGKNKSIIIRKKIAMRSGETDIAEIVENELIEKELKKLSRLTNHIGNLDCDIFIEDKIVYILELNARFGGGYPFSHIAGCNLPKAICEWIKGNDVPNELLLARIGVKAFKEIAITKEIK